MVTDPPATSPLLRGPLAPDPRTLVDIFRGTAEQVPDEPAVDAGTGLLTYAELEEAADELADELALLGIGPGDRVGIRVNSGTTDLYIAILGVLLAGAAYVPVDADDPDERARLVFDEAEVAAIVGNDLVVVTPARPGPPRPPGARPGRRRLGDLHLRLDRYAEGRGRDPPQRRGVRGRRGPDVPPGGAARRR